MPPEGTTAEVGAGDYFCYISRNKVDRLLQTIEPEAVEAITATTSRETTKDAEAGASFGIPHILSLFKIGGTYGRKDIITRERQVKETYAAKLQTILLALAADRPIPDVVEALRRGEWQSLYYHYAGTFTVATQLTDASVDSVITIRSDVQGFELLLDCSVRNFSEGTDPNGHLIVHSGNSRFFTGDISPTFSTVFVLLSHTPERVTGSPLFLELSVQESDDYLLL
jgi:hypothetical protein